MRTSSQATLYLWANDDSLKKAVEKQLQELALKIETKRKEDTDYRVLLITTHQHENLNSLLITTLEDSQNYMGKICLVVAGNSQTDSSLASTVRSLATDTLKNKLLNIRILVTYDLYDPDSQSVLGDFHAWVCQAATDQKVVVSSSGKNQFYPTAVSDLCQLIIKSLFVTNTSGELFTATGESLTDLETAYLIKKSLEKKDLSLDLDLKGKTNPIDAEIKDLSIQTQALINWLPKTSLSDILDQLVSGCLPQSSPVDETEALPETSFITPFSPRNEPLLHRLQPFTPAKQPKEAKPNPFDQCFSKLKSRFGRTKVVEEDLHQTEKRGFVKFLKFAVVTAIVLTALPFVVTVVTIYSGTQASYQAYQHLRMGEEQGSRRLLNRARTLTALANRSYHASSGLLTLVSPTQAENTSNYLSILGHGQDVLVSALDSYTLGSELYQSLFSGRTIDQKGLTAALRINLVALSEKLSLIQLLIGKIELPGRLGAKLQASDLTDQINLLKSQISLGLPLLDIISAITTNPNPQRYLVLIQDPNELRPSGGFLTSTVLVTLDQGKVINLEVSSALALDRLIEGRIEPPAIVKNLLGTTSWLFHDSNLDANFASSANQVAWFFDRFKGGRLDGVIGLNLYFYKYLLAELGPQKLPSGQTISTDNLFEFTSNPTASQGVDTVTVLTQTLSEKLKSTDINFAILARTLLKVVNYNEINLWFRNQNLTVRNRDTRLAGDLGPFPCHPQLSAVNCQPDTIYLNEANFSVSKVNFYLKRKQTIAVNISDDGTVAHTLIYDYSYPVPAPTNLAIDYKAHYQLYLPGGARDLQIALDGQILDAKTLIQTVVPPLVKVEFSASQVVNQSHQLVVKFTSPTKLYLTEPQTALALTYLKQPGTLNDQVIFKLHFPEKLQPRLLTLPFKQTSASELILEVSPASNTNLGVLFKNTTL